MKQRIKIKEGLSYEVVVQDRRGKFLKRIAAPSRSYMSAWNQCLYVLNRHSSFTIIDTGGTGRSISYSSSVLRANAGAGEIGYGIRVGKARRRSRLTIMPWKLPAGKG